MHISKLLCIMYRKLFFLGTMSLETEGEFPPNKGSFFSVNNDLVLKKQVTPVTISNGIAWSLNDDTLYYIDSTTRKVVGFDYNPQTGEICKKSMIYFVRYISMANKFIYSIKLDLQLIREPFSTLKKITFKGCPMV